jgi:hypothetical protein
MRLNTFLKSAFVALALLGGAAQANVIVDEFDILATDPGSVQYFNFAVTTAGSFTISAEGSSSLGAVYNSDPEIFLFKDGLTTANFLIGDDDSGVGLNALISNYALATGNYILAISEFSFTLAEAISGINASSVDDPGLVRVTISSNDGIAVGADAPVPAPLPALLLALGLLGLAAKRRR